MTIATVKAIRMSGERYGRRRQRLGGCERHDAAHARPGEHGSSAPADRRILHFAHIGLTPFEVAGESIPAPFGPFVLRRSLLPFGTYPLETIGDALFDLWSAFLACFEAPDDRDDEQGPDDQQHDTEKQPDPERAPDAEHAAPGMGDDRVQLDAHQKEDAVFEEELDRAPVDLLAQARLGRERSRGPVPGVDPRHNDGEDAGRSERLRGDERDERDDEGDRRLQHRILQLRPDPDVHHSDEQSDDDRDDHRIEKRAADRPQAERGAGGPQSGLEEHEGGCVVDEAFALEHGDQTRRKTEALRHGSCSNRIRRTDDSAQSDGEAQVQPGQDGVQQEAHDERCHDDEEDGQQRDGAEIAPEVGELHLHRIRVEQRREHQGEDDPRRHRALLRQTRQERRGDADDDEHQWRCHSELLRERGHRDDGDDTDDSDQRDLHGPTLQADGLEA